MNFKKLSHVLSVINLPAAVSPHENATEVTHE